MATNSENSATFLQIDLITACLCIVVVLLIFSVSRITPTFIKRDTQPIREITFKFSPKFPSDLKVYIGSHVGRLPSKVIVPILQSDEFVTSSEHIQARLSKVRTVDSQLTIVSFRVSHDDAIWPLTFSIHLTREKSEDETSLRGNPNIFEWTCSASPGAYIAKTGQIDLNLVEPDTKSETLTSIHSVITVTAEFVTVSIDGNEKSFVVFSDTDD